MGIFHPKKRARVRLELLEEQNYRCEICGGLMTNEDVGGVTPFQLPMRATFEHIIPRQKGNIIAIDNLCMTHAVCNIYRGTHEFESYRRKYGTIMYNWYKKNFEFQYKPNIKRF